jgi:hypothetical protein
LPFGDVDDDEDENSGEVTTCATTAPTGARVGTIDCCGCDIKGVNGGNVGLMIVGDAAAEIAGAEGGGLMGARPRRRVDTFGAPGARSKPIQTAHKNISHSQLPELPKGLLDLH